MTGRDRLVIISVAVLIVLVLGWFAVVAPEREKAAGLNQQVASANSQLAAANSQAATARSAQAQYRAAYASVVSLGKAVPPSEEVPALVYQLSRASQQRNVQFASIASGGAGGSGSSSGSAASAAALSGFTPMPFALTFNGSFFNLRSLLEQIDRSAVITSAGHVVVSGRLLTIQGIKLAPVSSASSPAGAGPGHAASEQLSITVTATAYVLPATEGLTAGATPNAPSSGGSAQTAAAQGSPSSSSLTAPAIARVTP